MWYDCNWDNSQPALYKAIISATKEMKNLQRENLDHDECKSVKQIYCIHINEPLFREKKSWYISASINVNDLSLSNSLFIPFKSQHSFILCVKHYVVCFYFVYFIYILGDGDITKLSFVGLSRWKSSHLQSL